MENSTSISTSFATTGPMFDDNSTVHFATTGPMLDDNSTTRGTDAATTVELPFGIETFAPILMLELIMVVICNLVLMALVIKARKVNNNTNIYLFSLSMSSLLESIGLFTLTVTVFTRRWLFGRELCYVNDFLFRLTFFPILPTHALVSRDRYKAIKDPLNYWKVSTKKTYVLISIVWTVSGVLSLASLIWHAVRTPIPSGPLRGVECFFSLHLLQAEFTVSLIEILAISLFNGLWLISLSVYTMWHYVLVLRELHTLAKLRSQFRVLSNSSILKVNGQDKPLHCTAEERAAKSLALMFLFEFLCSLTSLVIISILGLMSLTSHENKNTSKFSAAIVLLLSIYILPGINPLILAVSNKRFRKRIRGLLKCELTPELEESNDYHHLDETDTVQLPSTGHGVSGTTKRRSLFVNRSKNSDNQCRPESSLNVQETGSTCEEVKTKVPSKRNASVATIGAVDIRIKESANQSKDNNIVNAWADQ